MRRTPLNAALLLFPLALATGSLAWADDDAPTLFVTTQDGAIHCDGHDVNVTSTNAKLSFTGHCNGVYFVGSGTTATIEASDLVQVSGSGLDITTRGKVAEVYSIGSNNRLHFDQVGELYLNSTSAHIEAKTIDTIEGVGGGNVVRWSSGKPTVNDRGSGNVLRPVSEKDED